MRCLKIHVSYNRKTIFSSDVKIQVLQQQILKWSTIYEISMPFPKKVQNESDFFSKQNFLRTPVEEEVRQTRRWPHPWPQVNGQLQCEKNNHTSLKKILQVDKTQKLILFLTTSIGSSSAGTYLEGYKN